MKMTCPKLHSRGVDNSAHLIDTIGQYAQQKILEIEKELESALNERSKELSERLQKEKSRISSQLQDAKELTEKQKKSNFELHQQKMLLKKQDELYRRIREELVNHLMRNKKDGHRILMKLKRMIIKQSQKKIKLYHIPKGYALQKTTYKADLDHFGIVGVVNENEEYELSIYDLLDHQAIKVNEIIGRHIK
jgi:vacuolar-type H+-ATPase subunit E/Vma4